MNSLRGYICNVLSNSYCIDMRNSISASNSDYVQCSCTVTKSCVTSTTVCVCIVNFILTGFAQMLIALILMNL
jgi:hypothetical protein